MSEKGSSFTGTINMLDRGVSFTKVATANPRIVASFKVAVEAGIDPLLHLDRLLEAGISVAAFGSNNAGAEKLEATVGHAKTTIEDVVGKVEASIKKQVGELAADDGALVKAIDSVLDSVRDEVEEMTAGEDSPFRVAMLNSLTSAQKAIREDIQGQVAKQKKEIAELLDPADPTSPLRSLSEKIDGITRVISQVQQEVTNKKAIEEVVAIGTAKGFDYEYEAIRAVQVCAGLALDDCEHTGNVTGRVPRNKMGDGVVDIKVGGKVFGRIVVEAKNAKLKKLDWEKEAAGSKANRAAKGFLGLCKNLDDMPNRSRVLILDEQSIVIAYDPEIDDPNLLGLVYQMVRMATLSSSGQLDGVNIAEVNRALDDAVKALEKFDSISKSAAAVKNSADSILKDANAIRTSISNSLGIAQSAISRGLEPEVLESATSQPELEA
jgi:hypothetical protein